MTEHQCPEDIRLWPIVLEGSVDHELQPHLDRCAVCQARIKSLRDVVHAVREIGWESFTEPCPTPPVSPLPESIGEYPILDRLGSGGQAEVYRAWHPRLKTDVVIKWFRPDALAEADSYQLTSLAQILSTIRHPHLGQVFDVGTEQGRHFMIMEYIKGHQFSNWVRKFKPTIPHIASVLSKAARAVDAVHKNGALHLDLKPGNIMIDDLGDPRVIDFGMAQLQGQGNGRSLLLAPGTPEYMSPEQYAGDANHISVASDVYGLGAVLYAALCDQPIRTPDHMRLVPDWSLIRRAPWPIRRICHKALAVRPQDRYESALAFADDLERFAQGQTQMRRTLAAALVLLGMGSLLWGISASHGSAPYANLVIENQRQIIRSGRLINEMRCSAVLSHSRKPCLMIATATAAPTFITRLIEESDADWRIARMHPTSTWIQIDVSAGPFLVLACAKREWKEAPSELLKRLLKSLLAHPLKYQLEILVDQDNVQIILRDSQNLPPEELAVHSSILKIITEIQNFLNQHLPYYSGVVVIPAASRQVASIH